MKTCFPSPPRTRPDRDEVSSRSNGDGPKRLTLSCPSRLSRRRAVVARPNPTEVGSDDDLRMLCSSANMASSFLTEIPAPVSMLSAGGQRGLDKEGAQHSHVNRDADRVFAHFSRLTRLRRAV